MRWKQGGREHWHSIWCLFLMSADFGFLPRVFSLFHVWRPNLQTWLCNTIASNLKRNPTRQEFYRWTWGTVELLKWRESRSRGTSKWEWLQQQEFGCEGLRKGTWLAGRLPERLRRDRWRVGRAGGELVCASLLRWLSWHAIVGGQCWRFSVPGGAEKAGRQGDDPAEICGSHWPRQEVCSQGGVRASSNSTWDSTAKQTVNELVKKVFGFS